MCDVFIANKELKDISPEVIKAVRANESWILENIRLNNAYVNSKTSYILKHGVPTSYIKRVVC